MFEQIKASAGSGKTHTLTLRFLEQLREMSDFLSNNLCKSATLNNKEATNSFSEILAMTFTNKAATEMKNRVVKTLKLVALKNGKAPKEAEAFFNSVTAKRWVDSLLRRYDYLNIRTIDSLLTLLLRISSIQLQIPPDFELAFDDSEFLDPLYDSFLDRASKDEEEKINLENIASYLVYHTGFEGINPRARIRTLVLDVLAKLQLEGMSIGGTVTPPCNDANLINARITASIKQVNSSSKKLLASMNSKKLSVKKNFIDFLNKCLELTDDHKDVPDSAYLYKESLVDCVLKASIDSVTHELEAEYLLFCESFHIHRSSIAIYKSALLLLPFTKVALSFIPDLKIMYEDSGKIPSSILPQLARKTIEDPEYTSEAFFRLGSRLTHILIDEFQDTSREQWQVIRILAEEALSRGGSMRYVGDVKQAIYSWRGGDSTLFDEVVNEESLVRIDSTPLFTPLEYNWRSSPQVVKYNNAIFSQIEDRSTALEIAKAILPKKTPDNFVENTARMLQNSFSGVSQKLPENKKIQDEGLINLVYIDADCKDEIIEKTKQEFQALFENELIQNHSPGDIAILIRKHEEAALASSWLMDLGIKVITEHSFTLGSNPLIQRIIAFLRFLDYPADDLSFWNFISGEECFGLVAKHYCKFDTNKLDTWIAEIRLNEAKNKLAKRISLFQHFRSDFKEVWDLLIDPFYNQAGFMSSYDTVCEFYNLYNLEFIASDQNASLNRLLEVIHSAEGKGYTSTAAFLDFWDNKDGHKEKVVSPSSPDAVRIMTIHAAKGLEFKVVVMPFHSFTDSNEPELKIVEYQGLKLLVKDMKELGDFYYSRKEISSVEKMHLLYVGWTRAECELHCIILKDNEKSSSGMPKVLSILLNNFKENHKSGSSNSYRSGNPVLTNDASFKARAVDTTILNDTTEKKKNTQLELPLVKSKYETLLTEYNSDWLPMNWLPKLNIFKTPISDIVYNEKMRGNFMHKCLENLYIIDESDVGINKAIEQAVELVNNSFNIPDELKGELKDETKEALIWFCSQEDSLNWLKFGLRERSMLDENGNLFRTDLLYEDASKILVIDYKSGSDYEDNKKQITNYIKLLSNIYEKSISGVLVYLDKRKIEIINSSKGLINYE